MLYQSERVKFIVYIVQGIRDVTDYNPFNHGIIETAESPLSYITINALFMEIVKILWIVIFFFFTLVLFFTWAKINVISTKIKRMTSIIEDIEKIQNKDAENAVKTAEIEKKK